MKKLFVITLLFAFCVILFSRCEKIIQVPANENMDEIGLPSFPADTIDTLFHVLIDSLHLIECPGTLPYGEAPDPDFQIFSDTGSVLVYQSGNFQVDDVLEGDLPFKTSITSPILTSCDSSLVCIVRENSYQSGFFMGKVEISREDLELLASKNRNWFYIKSQFITAGIHFNLL